MVVVAMAYTCANAAEAPPRPPIPTPMGQAMEIDAAQLSSLTIFGQLGGNLAPPLSLALTDLGINGNSAGDNNGTFDPMGKAWSDAKTKGNTMKAIRALKLHVLKSSANITNEFFGIGSKTMTMVFNLKKLPSGMKALPIPLPHPLAHPTEGLFLRTAGGKRALSVLFGRGDMEVDALVQNAMAVTRTVCKGLDTSLVRDVAVDADRLALPVWNRRLWDRGKHSRSTKSSTRTTTRKGSMEPPRGPPLKKVRTI